jgi:hypothetical protein
MRYALLALPLLASCAKCGGSSSAPVTTAPSASTAAPSSRCVVVGKPTVFGAHPNEDAAEGPVAYGAELGGAAADDKAFVVGARTAGLTGVAHVLEVSFEGSTRSIVQLPAGAHAPLVAVGGGKRFYGSLGLAEKSRLFRVFSLDAQAPSLEVAEGRDESEVTAFLPGLVAWDDVDEKAGIGRIRARVSSFAGDAGNDDDVISPKESDAAWPTIALSPSGDRAVLVWASEKPEAEPDSGGEPSQLLAYRWLEAAVIDVATGRRVGAARALTATDGHAQTFSALWGDAGLIVVVRDDPRPTDGDGGELIALRAPIDNAGAIGEPARISIAEKDVAPGVASLVRRPSGALVAWLSHDGSARLSPAFTPGNVTVEPALHDRRVIASHDDLVLASRIVGSGLELSVARCTQ